MTYKETLFFIGKCLTITHEKHNRLEVEQELKNQQVDWDAVVKVSTAQYVFPALYCNLKRANFLSYLPEELVNYMIHITNLNRNRNQQIIDQAKEINELLLSNNITPIFLKGTGFLLQDFYEDIAERMVGDIDFLVSDTEFKKTITILNQDGYSGLKNKKYYHPKFHRHYKTLIKENNIGAIEIHSEILKKNANKYFNYNSIFEKILMKNNSHFLGLQDQFILTILAKQINDNGYLKKNVQLRNLYDVFLLAHKTETKQSIHQFPKFEKEIDSFLTFYNYIFSKSTYPENKTSKKNVNKMMLLIENPICRKLHQKKVTIYLQVSIIFKILFKSVYKIDYRNYLFNRLSNSNWIKEKILGSKPNS